MSVKRDTSGRRLVQAEVEVPGTPEEVWRAIATGPGAGRPATAFRARKAKRSLQTAWRSSVHGSAERSESQQGEARDKRG